MATINPSYLPIKSGRLGKEVSNIVSEDMDYAYRSLKGSGVFGLLIGGLCVLMLSLLKVVVRSVKYSQKPKSTYDPFALNPTVNQHYVDPYDPTLIFREALGKNENQYDVSKYIKCKKSESIIELRNYLYAHDLALQGYILKTTNHKLTAEEFIDIASGNPTTKRLSTTQITFGNKLNELIEAVLSQKVTLKRKRNSESTYLIVENDDYGFLQQLLRDLYNEPIKVKFDDI